MKLRPEHKAHGDPCTKCGLPLSQHRIRKRIRRPEHNPVGNPCVKCGQPSERHIIREKRTYETEPLMFIGIDGEGQGQDNHVYTYLAASNRDDTFTYSVENQKGLSSLDCLRFFMMLPSSGEARIFSYFFSYDITKILEDLPNELIYKLWRPSLRPRPKKSPGYLGPLPIVWKGFKINLRASKLSIQCGEKRVIIWDIGKFYQSKFVDALRLWKVGDEKVVAHMAMMKNKRSEFDKESFEDVKAYCQTECRYLADLAEKLYDAHVNVGLKLKTFYGAGSSASAMLKKMEIAKYLVPVPSKMMIPVARAFSGGRFENGRIGKIEQKVFGKDISGAYVYQLCFLPCLKHGEWEHTTSRSRMTNASHALIRYTLRDSLSIDKSWGPFPHRDDVGSICYPIESKGGWVWKSEYMVGERMFSNVQFLEAWIFHSACDCKPFESIPSYYNERCRIGKSGPGIVLKLGTNSCYGKVVQSIGAGQYTNWIWGGMITSGCRAQNLEVLELHEQRSNMLMIATDGIYSLEDIKCPKPMDTGTSETGKPLGGWESDAFDDGVFMVRPGVYFPLSLSMKELGKVRGRGLGKEVVYNNAHKIITEWEEFGIEHKVAVANISRFCGGKTSISRSGIPDKYTYKRAGGTFLPGLRGGERAYGQWINQKIEIGFDPMPKREGISKDGKFLITRKVDTESCIYGKALSPEALALKITEVMMNEQPDGVW